MGRADYLALGDWNAICDACGRKRKGSTLQLQWNGLRVCPEHWESRHPQDFVRALPESPTPAFVRQPADVMIDFLFCTVQGSTAIPGWAMPACMTPSRTSQEERPYSPPSVNTAIAGLAIASRAISGRGYA